MKACKKLALKISLFIEKNSFFVKCVFIEFKTVASGCEVAGLACST